MGLGLCCHCIAYFTPTVFEVEIEDEIVLRLQRRIQMYGRGDPQK